MQILISLVPLTLICILYAAYIKLSARILRSTVVSWKHSFIFCLVIVLLTLAGRVGASVLGISLPLVFGIVYGLMLHLGFGGWFFSTRSTSTQGLPLGWRGGMQLTAIAFGLLGLTIVLLGSILHFVGLPRQP